MDSEKIVFLKVGFENLCLTSISLEIVSLKAVIYVLPCVHFKKQNDAINKM